MSDKVIPLDVEAVRRTKPLDVFSIKSHGELLQMPKEEYLVKRMIPRQGFGVLYGASGSLKSFVGLDLCYAVALGRPWAQRGVARGPAVYVAAEGASGLSKRVAGVREAKREVPESTPFFLVPASPNLGATNGGDLRRLIASIEASRIAPRIVVLDTLAQMLHGADENGIGMTAFVRNAQALSSRFGCFVLAVHHIGHHAETRLRGHSSLPAAADLIIRAERLPDAPGATLTVEKSKDGPTDISLTANMRRVELGRDDDGDEISTLVVDSIVEGVTPRGDRRAKGKPAKLPAGAKTALRALDMAIKDRGCAPHEAGRFPPGVSKVVAIDDWRETAYGLGITDSPEQDARRMAFRRAYDKLVELGKAEVRDGFAWAA